MHPIFYLVNAEGSGHSQRATAILQHLTIPVIVATESPELFSPSAAGHDIYQIPPLRTIAHTALADDILHMPYGQYGQYLSRVQAICDLCQQHRCQMAIIDVCVEAAMLMRLCGIPYLYMRMSGRRDDAAHLQCYRAAAGLIASYPAALEEAWVPPWMLAKTQYVGGIAKVPAPVVSDIRAAAKGQGSPLPPTSPYVLVMRGRGESRITAASIQAAAKLVADYYWIGIGFDGAAQGQNFQILPYVREAAAYIERAAVVIANTGNNSVLEVGRHRKPLITLPEWRFFDEQRAKAHQLEQLNLAVTLEDWPTSQAVWQQVLHRAQMLETGLWSEILAKDGAQQAAEYIMQKYFALTQLQAISA